MHISLCFISGCRGPHPTSRRKLWTAGVDRINRGAVQRFTQDWGGAGYQSYSNKQVYGSEVIGDASYLRLKNISVSYDLPGGWLKRMQLQQFRIYCMGQNLLTWTNYSGLDPETLSFRNIPPLKVYTVGAKITL